MEKIDPFTIRRILKHIDTYRSKTGQLPTLESFEENGISRKLVDEAVRQNIVEKFYVTLTNGTVVKGYRRVVV